MEALDYTPNQEKPISDQYNHAKTEGKLIWFLVYIKSKTNTMTEGSPSLTTMVILKSKRSKKFITGTSTHMLRKKTHWGHRTDHPNNQVAREIWISLNTIQEIQKMHENIIGTRHGNLP